MLAAGKYGIEYSLASASDGPCPHGWAHAENGVPSVRFSTLTTAASSVRQQNHLTSKVSRAKVK